MLGGGAPPASWTKEIAAHIKSLAPNALIFDGTDGLTTYGGDLGNTGVGLSSVDLVYVDRGCWGFLLRSRRVFEADAVSRPARGLAPIISTLCCSGS